MPPKQPSAIPAAVWRGLFQQLQETKAAELDLPDQIVFGGLVRFLGEHRLLWHGAGGEESRTLLEEFEKGFRRIPGDPNLDEKEDHFFQQARSGNSNLLRCWMGDDSRFADRESEPEHEGQIDAPFVLHQHATTNALYRLFDAKHKPDKAYSPTDNCPVIEVDFYDSWACAAWYGGYLPDEVQWEFACRGQIWEHSPPRTLFYFGIDTAFADDKNNEAEIWQLVTEHTWNGMNSDHAQPVGGKWQNQFGLCDMLGNVWEWTWSPYLDNPRELKNAQGTAASLVVRGGSWYVGDLRVLRSSFRSRSGPGLRSGNLGFRIVRAVPRPPESTS